MATQGQEVTKTKTALAGTVAASHYAIQNTGNREVRIAVSENEPADDTNAVFTLSPLGGQPNTIAMSHLAGESIWVWCGSRNESTVAYEPS